MKKISMIELSRRAMGAREMNALTGGNVCGCGCHGSSSTQANANRFAVQYQHCACQRAALRCQCLLSYPRTLP
ncbi:MAG: TIGR04149 family rSAM-modified RiPP [Prevotella sp.]|nr:TIGR04149 family rSAM-modified RiPP [Prevotella sp.]